MLSSDGADNIYPPSEDTHLLMDVLMSEEQMFAARGGAAAVCLEIGIGSGAVSRLIVERYGCHVIGVDVNGQALRLSKSVSKSGSIDLIRADIVSWVRASPAKMFDVVLFNPPYVPTDQDELRCARVATDISASWAGGRRGREVMDVALGTVRTVLTDGGVFYLVVEESNDVADVLRLAGQHGLVGEVLRQRNAGREKLYVLRFFSA